MEFKRARRMPMPLRVALRRRVTRTLSREFIEDLHVGEYRAKLDRRATRALRGTTDIKADVFVDSVEGLEIVDPGDEVLGSKATTEFRGVVAGINLLAQNSGDLQFASKECKRKMSAPRERDMEGVKRIGRYLCLVPRVVTLFAWQNMPNHITASADSIWAGCKETRKRTPGKCCMRGKHLLRTYPRT